MTSYVAIFCHACCSRTDRRSTDPAEKHQFAKKLHNFSHQKNIIMDKDLDFFIFILYSICGCAKYSLKTFYSKLVMSFFSELLLKKSDSVCK